MAGNRIESGPAPGRAATIALMLAGVACWLWPIGLGGRMPVGGDAGFFSIGLMAQLRDAIQAGRLPLWNDLWGFGFPALAESQMGVYYPPHWLLYGDLPVEVAYVASLVGHTAFGALGAAWAARRLGASRGGAALAGFAWSTCGFFLIHLPHQWGYTVGSWMPWVWGLAWEVARGHRPGCSARWLAAALAVQTLPGHFQLAFNTQVGGLILAGVGLLAGPVDEGPRRRRRALLLLAAFAAAAPLAAAQLGPTYRLAALASSRRDFEYLSGFAASPIHLVTYLAPGLLHRSPLWRPLAWDPFHTSPEEHLGYVGLVPLLLAMAAARRGARRDPAARALLVVALATLWLGFGPYAPGFDWFRRLPGFSFFRAPARWGLATALATCLLAARGFDEVRSWPRPGRSLARFAAFVVLAPLAWLATFEAGLAATDGPGWPSVIGVARRGMRALPWSGDPDFVAVMARSRRPQTDFRVASALARQGRKNGPGDGPRFDDERWEIYKAEGAAVGPIVVGLLILIPVAARRRGWLGVGLVALTAADLIALGRRRPFDLGPIRPLEAQSPVLARWAAGPRGARTLDLTRNLPMVAGAAPISAYRTLDLPVLEELTAATLDPTTPPARVAAGMRALGASSRLFTPMGGSAEPPGWSRVERIEDHALAGWLLGVDWVAAQGPAAAAFQLRFPDRPAAIAWLVEVDDRPGALDSGRVLDVLGPGAIPMAASRVIPERLEVEVDVPDDGRPRLVIISQLDHPDWQAGWVGGGSVAIGRAFGGWQAIRAVGPGRRTLRLEYRGRDAQIGLAISAVGWACWAASFGIGRIMRDRGRER